MNFKAWLFTEYVLIRPGAHDNTGRRELTPDTLDAKQWPESEVRTRPWESRELLAGLSLKREAARWPQAEAESARDCARVRNTLFGQSHELAKFQNDIVISLTIKSCVRVCDCHVT